MADREEEKENPLESEKAIIPVESEYLEVSQQAAVREVELPKEDANKPKTLTESMDEATDLTDMQFAAAHLFPKQYSRKQAQIARIAPDAFLSLVQIMVTDKMMCSDPGKPINVNDMIFESYYDLTIGLDGRGRIDYAELLGAAKEIKKEEQLIKGL